MIYFFPSGVKLYDFNKKRRSVTKFKTLLINKSDGLRETNNYTVEVVTILT